MADINEERKKLAEEYAKATERVREAKENSKRLNESLSVFDSVLSEAKGPVIGWAKSFNNSVKSRVRLGAEIQRNIEVLQLEKKEILARINKGKVLSDRIEDKIKAQKHETAMIRLSMEKRRNENKAAELSIRSQLDAAKKKRDEFSGRVSYQRQEVKKGTPGAGLYLEREQALRDAAQGEVDALQKRLKRRQQKSADDPVLKQQQASMLESMQTEKKLIGRKKKVTDKVGKYESRITELNEETASQRKNMKKLGWTLLAEQLMKLMHAIKAFIDQIRKTQQQFGIAASQAAKLKFENFVTSVKSTIGAITSFGQNAMVSAEQIANAQQAFQQRFGGVLTGEAAEEIARQAKEMGVTAEALAEARLVFMTQTGGDLQGAVSAQADFIANFERVGLTAKDAMEAIKNNSELLARNGTRFAASFARAAAEAKKIGVDLSKIDQVGDNIIGNFEGFLEKSAELGAMGFNLDTSSLAEIAETGDTGALFQELQSQLAATGKDLNNLKRSEQLALSEAFGIPMAELQRMAGAGDGAEDMSGEEKQIIQSNEFLRRTVNLLESVIPILTTGFAAVTAAVAARNMGDRLLGGRGRTAVRVRQGVRSLTAPVSRMARFGGGAVAGALGAFTGYGNAREQGLSRSVSAGQGAIQGGAAAAGTIIGAMGGPLGMAIGGFLGNFIGKKINEMFPEWGQILGERFARLGEALAPLKEAFSELGSAIGQAWALIAPALEPVGSFFGKIGEFAALILGGALVTAISAVTMAIEGWVGIFTVIANLFTGLISKITEVLPNIPGIGRFFRGEGDDVVSRAGYGDRALVTPDGVISLNNRDNVVAYADDMISNAVGAGVRMLSLGAIGKEADKSIPALDTSNLERKLDQVVAAIAGMQVQMDANKVGEIIVNNERRMAQSGTYRAQRNT